MEFICAILTKIRGNPYADIKKDYLSSIFLHFLKVDRQETGAEGSPVSLFLCKVNHNAAANILDYSVFPALWQQFGKGHFLFQRSTSWWPCGKEAYHINAMYVV